MKKTLSMVLALVMLLSTISCLGITASAAADGIKYFTMEFLIDGKLEANKKLTVDYASEVSYRKQCEDYLYAEGNVLTMYTTDGDKVAYESNAEGVYVEKANTDGDILAMIVEFLGLGGSDGRKIYPETLFVGDVNINGEANDYFTVNLTSGLKCEVYVDLVGYPKNFPVAISYVPATTLSVVENCCGYYAGGQFIYDDIAINHLGDRLVLDYIGQPDVEYVFEGDGYFDDYYNAMPGELTVDVDATVAAQLLSPWSCYSSSNYATVTYTADGQTINTTVPVRVAKSDVKSISYVANTALEVFENSCGEWDDYFVYNLDHFKNVKDNAIVVEYVDGAKFSYVCNGAGAYVAADGSELDADHLYWNDTQAVNAWTVAGDGVITISYRGASATVDVDVLENPIASVEFSSPEILKVKEGVDGEWYTNRDGDKDFYYSCDKAFLVDGAAFTVNYKDGTSSAYVFNGSAFVNAAGEEFDLTHVKVSAYSQDSKAWEINNVYDFQLVYLGVLCDIPVKAIPADVPATPVVKAANVVNGVNLTWNTMLEAETYCIYKRVVGANAWTLIAEVEGGSYLDKAVKNDVTYQYAVRAKNDNGLSAYVSKNTVKIEFVATPVMDRIINATTGIYIDWAKVPGATHYRVYRRAAGEGYWKYMGQTRNLWWVDKGLANANGGYYRYTVRAVSRVGNVDTFGGYDAEGLLIKRLANPMVKSATDCATGIEIKWKAVAGTTGYYVYRKVVGQPDTAWVCLGSAAGTKTTSFIDTTAVAGVSYQYTVRSCWGKTLSSYNEGVIYGAPDMPELKTITNKTNGVEITWAKAARATAYRVYRRTAGGSWVFLGTTTATSYLDTAAPNGKYVAYTVKAVNSLGLSSCNTQGLLTKYVATPKLTSATYNAKSGAVTVKWSAVAGATEYHVYRRVAGGSWVLIDSTSFSYYVDKDVSANGYYVYTVRAVNDWRSAYESGIAVETVAKTDKF